MMKTYIIEVLNINGGDSRDLRASRHAVQNERMNFFRESDIVASYPADKVNIVDVKYDEGDDA